MNPENRAVQASRKTAFGENASLARRALVTSVLSLLAITGLATPVYAFAVGGTRGIGGVDLHPIYSGGYPQGAEATPYHAFVTDNYCRKSYARYYAPTSGAPLTYTSSTLVCGETAARTSLTPTRTVAIRVYMTNTDNDAEALSLWYSV